MRTVGIIGGLGPDTTAKFYSELVQRADLQGFKKRPGILIWSVDLDYEVEKQAIIEGRGQERILPLLIDAAHRLSAAGADFLVMPCNSLHIFIDKIRAQANIPVLSIVEESLGKLEKNRPQRTAILGSRITLQSQMYQQAMHQRGLPCLLPTSKQITELAGLVHKLVMNNACKKDHKALSCILNSLAKRGATHALLACTDLQSAFNGCKNLSVIDTFEVLLESTLAHIFAPLGDLDLSQVKPLQLARIGAR